MTVTDIAHIKDLPPAPVVVLVYPQLAENMGMVARAMLNFGLSELRVVKPKQPPDHPRGLAASAGADQLLIDAKIFETTEEALADCERVYATTARTRDMVKPVMPPRAAAAQMRTHVAKGERVAILFGRESAGLDNDDVALADAVVEAPLNPHFSSLNLSQAVMLLSYEWFQSLDDTQPHAGIRGGTRPANRGELVSFFKHLEAELDDCGFLRIKAKRTTMVRNIRNIFSRAALTEQEVRTLHGMVSELRWGRRPERMDKHKKPSS